MQFLVNTPRPVRKGHKPNCGHERTGEVGLCPNPGEPAEQRTATFRGGWGGKGTDWGEQLSQSHMRPTQSGKRMSQGLHSVRQAAKKRKQERFTALLHHLSVGLLRDSFYALQRRASPGIDGVTWQEYETGLEDRLIGFAQTGAPWSVSSETLTTSLYTEGRWAATSAGHRGPGGQNCSTGWADDPQPRSMRSTSKAFRTGFGSVAARTIAVGRADGGHPMEASELGA